MREFYSFLRRIPSASTNTIIIPQENKAMILTAMTRLIMMLELNKGIILSAITQVIIILSMNEVMIPKATMKGNTDNSREQGLSPYSNMVDFDTFLINKKVAAFFFFCIN